MYFATTDSAKKSCYAILTGTIDSRNGIRIAVKIALEGSTSIIIARSLCISDGYPDIVRSTIEQEIFRQQE